MMLWSHLPLIEMDDYNRNNPVRPQENKRPQDRDTGTHLEIDIGRQLSQLREQSRTSRNNYGSEADTVGRDDLHANDKEGERNPDDKGQERFRRMEGDGSPREWRRGRNGDMDRVRDRSRDRDRNWERDEPRRRPRDYGDRTEFSDGSEGSWEGGRDGDRERYRDRRRDRDVDRYRERRDRDHDYRDRDDRDWRRDRWEDRDRDDSRRRDYRDRRRSDDDGQWSDRSRDRYHDDREHHPREPHYGEPSEVVILKGLPLSIEDNQIHALLSDANLAYKDVRIVKNREGYSRGFAFVEFLDIEAAKNWIESCKGKLQVDTCSVIMDFSRSKTVMEVHKDWICGKCGTQNFSSKRRNTCFSCNAPKDENDEQKDVGQTPCKVLILRGLDTLTTEETIRHCLTSFTSLPIFDVRLIKDKMTGTSRGFCFIELGSIDEATKLLEEIQKASFKIDERTATVSYARFGTHPPKPSLAAQSGANSSDVTTTGTADNPSGSSSSSATQPRPKNSFAAIAIAQAHAAGKMGNTSDPTAPQISGAVAPAVPPASVPGYPPDPSLTPTVQPQPGAVAPAGQEQTAAPAGAPAPPPLSSYVYDATSGYYYDTTTGLYYDPSTQYYFNSTSQQYMYFDAATQQYVAIVSSNPASTDPADPTQEPSETEEQTGNKEKQKKAKSLNAKKIAKDMERWAKKVNVNKDVKDTTVRPQAAQSTEEVIKESTYQYDPNELKKTGIKLSLVGSSNMSSLLLTSSSPLAALSELDDAGTQDPAPAVAGSLVAEYSGDDDSGGEEIKNDDSFTDLSKMACLLCKRQFPTKEALTRHNQFSELHKQNLQVQRKLKMSFSEIDDYEKQQREAKYRDRAKERRELFGQPDSTPSPAVKPKKKRHGKATYEQPTKDGITSDNIGNKMLQAMGWTHGTGLGKDRQGIVNPISAKMRNRSAGLGLDGSDFGATAGDSTRDVLKKMAQSRYESLE